MSLELYYYEKQDEVTTWGLTAEFDNNCIRQATYQDLLDYTAAAQPITFAVKVQEGSYQWVETKFFDEEFGEWDTHGRYELIN